MDWFGEQIEYIKNLLVMLILAALVLMAYIILAPLYLLRATARHIEWIVLVLGGLLILAVWFWMVANYGFEGNGNGELLRIIKEAAK